MSRLFRLVTTADHSQCDAERTSPGHAITDTLEGMVDNYTDLVQWLDTFENTDARETIGFDLAMVICSCYNITARGLAGNVKKLFSDCKIVKSLDDVPRSDCVLGCCAKFCLDNTPTETILKIVADYAPECDNLQSLADRLKPQQSELNTETIRDVLCDRFQTLTDAIVHLGGIVGDTNKELSRERKTCQQLKHEKTNVDNTLAAKEEEHQVFIEARNASSASRIGDLAKQLEDHKNTIETMTLFHENEKRDWDTMKTKLANELQKTKNALREKTTQFAAFKSDSEQVHTHYKQDINALACEIEELTENKQVLQQAHASELPDARDEHSAALETIARLERTAEAEARSSVIRERYITELTGELETIRDELTFNKDVVSRLQAYDVALGQLSPLLDIDLKQTSVPDIPAIVNDKTVKSASWLEGILRSKCVARGNANRDEHDSQASSSGLFRVYESILTAAIRGLDIEQSPMEVADVRKPMKRRIILRIDHGKRTKPKLEIKPDGYNEKPEQLEIKPDGYKFKNPEFTQQEPSRAADPCVRIKADTCTGQGFKLSDRHKVDDKYTVAVSNHIANTLFQQHAGDLVLVDLGSDSPLSSLRQMLSPDSHNDHVASLGTLCHCLDLNSLASICECTLLICWSRSGWWELYGMEHSRKAIIIVDPGQGSTRHYYVLSGNRDSNEYVYNLAHVYRALVGKLTRDMFFTHTINDCRGPSGGVYDGGVTHLPVIEIAHIILM